MKSWKDRTRNRLYTKELVAPTSDPVVQAGKLWEQHCSWRQQCDLAISRCELGRKAYDLYAFHLRVAAWVAQDNSTTRPAEHAADVR